MDGQYLLPLFTSHHRPMINQEISFAPLPNNDYPSTVIDPALISQNEDQSVVDDAVSQVSESEDEEEYTMTRKCHFKSCARKDVFTSLSVFKEHLKRHRGVSYRCRQSTSDCEDSEYLDKHARNRHEREAHELDDNSLTCPVEDCNRYYFGFKCRCNLNDHMRRLHPHVPLSKEATYPKRVKKGVGVEEGVEDYVEEEVEDDDMLTEEEEYISENIAGPQDSSLSSQGKEGVYEGSRLMMAYGLKSEEKRIEILRPLGFANVASMLQGMRKEEARCLEWLSKIRWLVHSEMVTEEARSLVWLRKVRADIRAAERVLSEN